MASIDQAAQDDTSRTGVEDGAGCRVEIIRRLIRVCSCQAHPSLEWQAYTGERGLEATRSKDTESSSRKQRKSDTTW